MEEGRLEVFKGSYREFLDKRVRSNELAKAAAIHNRKSKKEVSRKAKMKAAISKKSLKRLNDIENQIAEIERHLSEIAERLQVATEAQAFDNIHSLSIEYAQTEEKLELLLIGWEELASQNMVSEEMATDEPVPEGLASE